MTPTPNDWTIGLAFLLAALFIVRRDIGEWVRAMRQSKETRHG